MSINKGLKEHNHTEHWNFYSFWIELSASKYILYLANKLHDTEIFEPYFYFSHPSLIRKRTWKMSQLLVKRGRKEPSSHHVTDMGRGTDRREVGGWCLWKGESFALSSIHSNNTSASSYSPAPQKDFTISKGNRFINQ